MHPRHRAGGEIPRKMAFLSKCSICLGYAYLIDETMYCNVVLHMSMLKARQPVLESLGQTQLPAQADSAPCSSIVEYIPSGSNTWGELSNTAGFVKISFKSRFRT